MKNIAIKLIQVYRKLISPLFAKRCRFYPSCSEYAIEAIDTRGLVKGILLSIWRILRCNPFHPGGFDPVNRLKGK